MSKFVGESEKGVRETFKTAKQASPAIIFFDEIDAVVPRRGSGIAESGVTERVVSQFLAEMDGIEELKGVVVLAATNRLDMIDPALLRGGRFDLVIELPFPMKAQFFHIRDPYKEQTSWQGCGFAGARKGNRRPGGIGYRIYLPEGVHVDHKGIYKPNPKPETRNAKREAHHIEEAFRGGITIGAKAKGIYFRGTG